MYPKFGATDRSDASRAVRMLQLQILRKKGYQLLARLLECQQAQGAEPGIKCDLVKSSGSKPLILSRLGSDVRFSCTTDRCKASEISVECLSMKKVGYR